MSAHYRPFPAVEKKWRDRFATFSAHELRNELAVYAARVENPATSPALRDAARDAVYTIKKLLEGAK